VSTEDERFYEHSGIDAKRTVGAALKLGANGGASTITQQLAKLLFHGELMLKG
jgi:penicillin-binding protein 1A